MCEILFECLQIAYAQKHSLAQPMDGLYNCITRLLHCNSKRPMTWLNLSIIYSVLEISTIIIHIYCLRACGKHACTKEFTACRAHGWIDISFCTAHPAHYNSEELFWPFCSSQMKLLQTIEYKTVNKIVPAHIHLPRNNIQIYSLPFEMWSIDSRDFKCLIYEYANMNSCNWHSYNFPKFHYYIAVFWLVRHLGPWVCSAHADLL